MTAYKRFAAVILLAFGLGFQLLAQTNQFAVWGMNGSGEAWVPPSVSGIRKIGFGLGRVVALKDDGHFTVWGDSTSLVWQTNMPTRATNIATFEYAGSHMLTLSSNGNISAWCDPSSIYGSELTNPPIATGFAAIAANSYYSLGLRTNGQVYAWGPANPPASCPRVSVMNGQTGIKAIAAGTSVALMLRSNGTVLTFYGPPYTHAPPSDLTNAVAIAAGDTTALALRSDGTVVQWALPTTQPPPVISNAVAIYAGQMHYLASCSDGTLIGWGWTNAGQCSLPSGITNVTSVGAAGLLSYATVEGAEPRISKQPKSRSIVSGMTIKLGCSVVGKLPFSFQWQHNNLDIASATNSILVLSNLSSADAGSYQVVVTNPVGNVISDAAQLTMGPLVSWGVNRYEETEVPAGLSNVQDFHARIGVSSVTTLDGKVASWAHTISFPLSEYTNAAAAIVDSFQSVMLNKDGTLKAFSIVTNDDLNRTFTNIFAYSAGADHVAAIKADGRVIVWGQNTLGQTNVPSSASNAVQIACGYYFTVVLRDDCRPVYWGNSTTVPASATNFVSIAAGDAYFLGLRADRTVQVAGSFSGLIPSSVTNVVAVAGDRTYAAALRDDGTIIGWGSGASSMITPPWVTNVIAISVGADVLALMGDGSPHFQPMMSRYTIDVGNSVRFPALVAGKQPMTYQWQFNGVDIPAQTNVLLSLDNVPITQIGGYRVIASNSIGVSTSAVTTVSIRRQPLKLSITGSTPATNQMLLRLTGLAGGGDVILSVSTNLTDWFPISTNRPLIGILDFTNPVLPEIPQLFYRAAEGL